MSFISYAQNYEDVILWRALKHIENGFYIDVGANDPVIESVTKAFYDRGWRGINIEPLPSHYRDLVHQRPRDINLQCAAGANVGEIEVWECDIRGWATASAEVITQHSTRGYKGIFHTVDLRPLRDICAEYVNEDIHFLKIDVEGFEKTVIEGMDFIRFRPWILVIEATKPNSVEEVYFEWEELIISNDYNLAYADGLNRYYLAKEHAELSDALRYPPNVFDQFIRVDQFNLAIKAQQAIAKANQAEAKAEQAEAKAEQAIFDSQQFFAQLHSIYASRSWRITAPFRWVSAQVKRLRREGLTTRTKKFIKKILRKINDELLLRPRARQKLILWSRKLGLKVLLKLLHAKAHGQIPSSNGLLSDQYSLTKLENLSPRAQQIYDNLLHTIGQQKLGGK
jgi:FkbM family methyltransferase